jgi:N4-gp56 family major capsid protein
MAVLTPAITVSAMTNFASAVVVLVEKKLEENLRSPLPFLNPVNYRSAKFVKGTNNTLRYLNIPDMTATTNSGSFSAGTSPWLEEGTPPTSEVLAFGYEEFSAYQAGRTLTVSDKALQENPIDLMANMADKISRNAIETANLWVQDKLKASTTNVMYAGGASSLSALNQASLLTGDDVKDAVALLSAANVSPFPDGTYHGIISPLVKRDLMSDNAAGGWIDAQRYQGVVAGGLMNGELGSYGGVRFVESSIITATTQAATAVNVTGVYTTGVFTTVAGDHGFAVGDKLTFASIGGGGTQFTATVPGAIYVRTVPSSTTFTASATRGGTLFTWNTADITSSPAVKANALYSTYILGPDSYAFGDWNAIEVFVTPPGGHTDPLHQSALIGWKGYFGAKLLGETYTTSAPAPRQKRIVSVASLS